MKAATMDEIEAEKFTIEKDVVSFFSARAFS